MTLFPVSVQHARRQPKEIHMRRIHALTVATALMAALAISLPGSAQDATAVAEQDPRHIEAGSLIPMMTAVG